MSSIVSSFFRILLLWNTAVVICGLISRRGPLVRPIKKQKKTKRKRNAIHRNKEKQQLIYNNEGQTG